MAKFAQRMAYMQTISDVVRYLFESMTAPDTISFGGGTPAKEALPVETVHNIASDIKYVYPEGGLFTWVKLPEEIDTTAMLNEAVEQKVAYMPGREFFVEGQPIHNNCMRISFGGLQSEKILIGMKRLAKVIRAKR